MPPRSRAQRIAWLLGVTLVYVAAGKIGLALDPVSGFATLVWAPSGIALAALVRGGIGLWPAVTVGAFLTNVWTGAAVPTAFGIAIGNTLEAVLGTAILLRAGGDAGPIVRLRSAFALITAALSSTLASAAVGVSSLALAGIVDEGNAQRTFVAWWLGDVLGDLVVAPVLLNWTAPSPVTHEHSRAERIALPLVTLGVAALAFSAGGDGALRRPYLIFLPLIWSATRFGSRYASLAVAASSAVAIAFAVRGVGPFVGPSLASSLIELQVFTGYVAAATLFLGAASDERLAAVLDAQRALRTRDEFLAIASHELKTPIAALALQLAALARHADPAAASGHGAGKDADRLERARVQVSRLTRLVDELLDVSRLTAGKLHLAPERFDLAEAVREIVARMREQAARAGCGLEVISTTPVVGTWDRVRIEQVIGNLLSNAFEHAPGRPVEVSVEASGACAIVRVRDHGSGIQPDDLLRIFERFERASRTVGRRGLGLGLYIARQVVDAHGGAIRAESACGAGSTFTVELPVAGHPSEAAAG